MNARYAAEPRVRERAKTRNAIWRRNNPEEARKRNRENFKKFGSRHLIANCLLNMRRLREKRGIDSTLTQDDLTKLIAPMVCEVTGLQLDFEDLIGFKKNPFAPSLDRVDSSLGYIHGNVQLVCWFYNHAKYEWSPEVVDLLMRNCVKD